MKFPMETSVPNRYLREGILDSEAVNRLSEEAELFYRRLMSVVDDYGRIEANLELLRARCFPLQLDRWPLSRVGQVLAECGQMTAECGQMTAECGQMTAECGSAQVPAECGSAQVPAECGSAQVPAECGQVRTTDGHPLVSVYESPDRGKKYLQINNFQQRTRSASKCPPPSVRAAVEESRSHGGHLSAHGGHLSAHGGHLSAHGGHLSALRGHLSASRARTPSPSPSPSTVVSYEVKEGGNGNGISAEPSVPPETAQMSQRFSDWWEIWSAVRGTAKRIQAVQAWLSIATVDLEAAIFECTASYLSFGVGRDGRGFNPDTFLFEQAKDNFHARWVPPKSKAQTRQEEWESA
jgi:hypothetical protein